MNFSELLLNVEWMFSGWKNIELFFKWMLIYIRDKTLKMEK